MWVVPPSPSNRVDWPQETAPHLARLMDRMKEEFKEEIQEVRPACPHPHPPPPSVLDCCTVARSLALVCTETAPGGAGEGWGGGMREVPSGPPSALQDLKELREEVSATIRVDVATAQHPSFPPLPAACDSQGGSFGA